MINSRLLSTMALLVLLGGQHDRERPIPPHLAPPRPKSNRQARLIEKAERRRARNNPGGAS